MTPYVKPPVMPYRLKMDQLDDRINPAPAIALSGNTLYSFDTDFPAEVSLALPVTGLGIGESLVGIDVRPQTGGLYGLASDGAGGVRLYSISRRTGVATPLTASAQRFADGTGAVVNVAGSNFGIDFNPTVDRLRVVTDAGVNFRMNPNDGTIVDGDNTTPNTQADGAVNGATTKVDATAYTNSFANATATTQYALDGSTGKLFIQNPPNAGTQTNAVSITINGQAVTFSAANGFDIPSSVAVATSNSPVTSGSGIALLNLNGDNFPSLVSIDLASGAAINRGFLGIASATGAVAVQGFALLPTGAPPAIGLSGGNLVRFNSGTPGTIDKTVAINGINAGESLVGIDLRPSNGVLYGLGVNETANNGTLYIIDPQNGGATVVGAKGSIALVDATGAAIDLPAASAGYGIDFNPAVDKLRVVTSTGLNFRVDPTTGNPIDGNTTTAGVNPDGSLNGGSSKGDATAYTNSFGQVAGKTITTQYTLDSASNKLFIQNPPNNGVLVNPLTVSVTFTAVNGFDIPASVAASASNAPVTSGSAIAGLTVGGKSQLYTIDLTSGAATLLGNIGDGTVTLGGLTIGDTAAAAVRTPNLLGSVGYAVGNGSGGTVNLYRPDGSLKQTITPFAGFTGSVRVASADFNNDGVVDVVVATGPGSKGQVRVLNGRDGTTELFAVTPFEDAFTGGLFVSTGDINADGVPDVVISPDLSGGPRVRIFGGSDFKQLADFFGIQDVNFRGGARTAVGDFNGDGFGDLVVSAGFGGGPRVSVYNGSKLTQTGGPNLFGDFFVLNPSLRDGAFVAAGDVNGDGFADLVASGGSGAAPQIVAVSGADLVSSNGSKQTRLVDYLTGDANNTSGARVAVTNIDGDNRADIITGSASGAGSRLTAFAGKSLIASGLPPIAYAFDAFLPSTAGVFVG